ncbi:Gll3359 protein [Mucinivorans hirudinis]|uniref:Gll3359 protein n=1 Tax=Mucinivorans hirudinis TaxID=1433126 RepID=A0A060RC15_9BACT|nr:Gll3359 protein [Mucinivorans hirudinis]
MANNYFGELIALAVAVSWTFTALFFEYAGKRIGSLAVNLFRLLFAFVLLGGMLFFTTGSFMPVGADSQTWFWMSLSGFVGFVFGDFCLFYSYLLITARFSQLIMTLAPPIAAVSGLLMLDEKLSTMGIIGMVVTLTGIAISIFKRNGNGSVKLNLSLRGLLFALGGALGQGLGIVLSKKGMLYYGNVEGLSQNAIDYIPFAATQMRIITGIVGFVLIILFSRRTTLIKSAIQDKKGMGATFLGAIFGPFVGVSLSLMAVMYANTGVASTIMATVPIMIIVPYIIIYKKRVTLVEVVGAVISVIGVSLFFVK